MVPQIRVRSADAAATWPRYDGGAQSAPLVLDRATIFVLPTAAGVSFGALLLVMLVGAMNYGSSLAYGFTFLLGSVAVVSILHTYRNLAGLAVSGARAGAVFAGQCAHFELLVQNASPCARHALEFSAAGGAPVVCAVAAEAATPVILLRDAPQRGPQHLRRVRVSTRWPLGLFRAWSEIDPRLTCVVYPAPARRGPQAQVASSGSPGRRPEASGGEDFLGCRSYRVGDAPRHVHWKAVARGQGLLTKQFGGYGGDPCWLDWDALAHLEDEARLQVLCRGVLDAQARGERYGLRLPGISFGPAEGPRFRHRCLEALARFGIA